MDSRPTANSGSAPAPAPTEARAWHPWRWVGGGLAVLVLLLVLGAAAVGWMLTTPSGTAWLLSMVPGVNVAAPRGSLVGDFSAGSLEATLPGNAKLRLRAPRWEGLRIARGAQGRWLSLTIAALHVDSVVVEPGAEPDEKGEPPAKPTTLRLPVELLIERASVGELRFGGAAAQPVRNLRARVHLGADGGSQHRLDDLAASHGDVRAAGSARVAADPPFAVDAGVELAPADGTPRWQARGAASGPLEALNVTATARVAATPTHAAQSLDARAVLRPFANWPLGELNAETTALDLAAFASAAPVTSLTGKVVVVTSGLDRPAVLSVELANGRAGRYDQGLLPLRHLRAELQARPEDPSVIDVRTFTAELGTAQAGAGRIVGRGRWAADEATGAIELQKLRPSLLDARAPPASVDGVLSLVGSGLVGPTDQRVLAVQGELTGQLLDPALPRAATRTARLRIDVRATERAIELRAFEARLGEASATLSGRLARTVQDEPWRAVGKLTLAEFDPAPWWPGAGAALRGRINGNGEFDLRLPTADPGSSVYDTVAATRGTAALSVTRSALAGVPLEAQASFANADGSPQAKFDVRAAGNRMTGDGRIAAVGRTGDEWHFRIDAPQLARLAPLVAPTVGAGSAPPLAGRLTATASVKGRWPNLTSQGELHAAALRYQSVSVRNADAGWQLGTGATERVEAVLDVGGLTSAGRTVQQAHARLTGTSRSHRAEIRLVSQALPPEWLDTLSAGAAASSAAPGSRPPAAPAAAPSAGRSEVVLVAEGGLVDAGGERAGGWRGTLVEFIARATQAPGRTWLQARNVRASVLWADGPLRVTVEPGQADAWGQTIRWSRIAFEGAVPGGAAMKLEMQAAVDPLPVAPILRRLQPDVGWEGDLAMAARIDVRSTPAIVADIVVERTRGDLILGETFARQSLGLDQARVAVTADRGVWRLVTALRGSNVGTVSGTVTARTGAATSWPSAATPIDGEIALRIADLSAWAAWLPVGWRIGGALTATAHVGGRLGAAEYTGLVEGSRVSARNFLQGVDITDGEFAIALEGQSARIRRFTARGGEGSLVLSGSATLGAAPVANLRLVADHFELLGRLDRRIVVSGSAGLRLDQKSIEVEGRFGVDEGLIDFTRADAPTLGDDVEVIRRPRAEGSPAARTQALAATPSEPAVGRAVDLDLRVDLGERLRIRGRGLDASLRGELRMTSPEGRLRAVGTVRVADGTYQAYGQKLAISRATITFAGPLNDPRLDIEATRPDLDVRVGVVVTGTVLNPRVRLFSEPELSDLDKLSWLVLGKPSTNTGGTETALLQRAALALLAGEGPGTTDKIAQALGLDQISLSAGAGGIGDAVVSVGKQISKNWYLGYEWGLNTAAGSWQLIYRLGQRFTVKAQAGGDNAIDLNWTLRWR